VLLLCLFWHVAAVSVRTLVQWLCAFSVLQSATKPAAVADVHGAISLYSADAGVDTRHSCDGVLWRAATHLGTQTGQMFCPCCYSGYMPAHTTEQHPQYSHNRTLQCRLVVCAVSFDNLHILCVADLLLSEAEGTPYCGSNAGAVALKQLLTACHKRCAGTGSNRVLHRKVSSDVRTNVLLLGPLPAL
jgi:hypothetical protein